MHTCFTSGATVFLVSRRKVYRWDFGKGFQHSISLPKSPGRGVFMAIKHDADEAVSFLIDSEQIPGQRPDDDTYNVYIYEYHDDRHVRTYTISNMSGDPDPKRRNSRDHFPAYPGRSNAFGQYNIPGSRRKGTKSVRGHDQSSHDSVFFNIHTKEVSLTTTQLPPLAAPKWSLAGSVCMHLNYWHDQLVIGHEWPIGDECGDLAGYFPILGVQRCEAAGPSDRDLEYVGEVSYRTNRPSVTNKVPLYVPNRVGGKCQSFRRRLYHRLNSMLPEPEDNTPLEWYDHVDQGVVEVYSDDKFHDTSWFQEHLNGALTWPHCRLRFGLNNGLRPINNHDRDHRSIPDGNMILGGDDDFLVAFQREGYTVWSFHEDLPWDGLSKN